MQSNTSKQEVVIFALVGCSNFAIDFCITLLLSWIFDVDGGVTLLMINTLAFSVAVINSYILNKTFTFKDNSKHSGKTFMSYILVSLFSLLVNNATVYLVTKIGSQITSGLLLVAGAKIWATAISMVSNYIGYKWLVFQKK